MYNLRGWRIPKGQSKCTISEVGEYRRGLYILIAPWYSPTSGEYRRGNQNVQSQRLENTEGAIKMYPRGWRIPKGQSKCTISEVGEYRRGNQNVPQRLENTEGTIKMYNLRGWRMPKGNHNVPQRLENTEGAIKIYNLRG